MRTNILPFLLISLFSLLASLEARAIDYYWVGNFNTNWNRAENWREGSLAGPVAASRPVSGDNVFFTSGSNPCNINVVANVANFTIDAGYTGIISLTSTTANVNGYSLLVDNFNMNGGTFDGNTNPNSIFFRNNFTQLAGSFTASKGELYFSGSGMTHTFNGAFTHNDNLLTTFAGNCAIYGSPVFGKLQFSASGKRTFDIDNTIEVTNDFSLAGAGNIFINSISNGVISLNNTANLTLVNTGTAGGGTALIRFEGNGNQNLYGANAPGESKLPRVQISKTSGTVSFYNTISFSNEFTNANISNIDATSNFSKVVFMNGASGLTGGTINNYTISGNTNFYDLEFSPSVNSEFNIPGGNTLSVANNFTISNTNRTTLNDGTIDLKGNMYVTNTSTSGGISTGVIRFSGTGTQHLYGSTTDGIGQLPKVEITKASGTLFMHDVVNLKGGLVVSGTGTIDDSDATIAVNGTMTIESTSNQLTLNHLLIPGNVGTNLTSNVNNSLQVSKLEINGTANVSLITSLIGSQNLDIKVSGDLINTNTGTANGGGNVNILLNGTGTQNLTGGTVVGGGKLPAITINKPGGTVNLSEIISLSNASNWTLTSGTVQPGNSTLVFANNGSVISGIQTLNNLTFAPSTASNHNYSFNSNTVTVSGNLTFDGPAGSSINISSGNIDVKQDVIINNGSLTNSGDALISMTGTTNQQILSNAAAGIPNLTVNKASGLLSVSSDINVRGTLAMTNGLIDMQGNTLTLGTSTALANRGTLNHTSGRVYNGTFARWYGTSAVPANNPAGLFPIGTDQYDRRLYISTTSTPTSGGIISVNHDPNTAAAATDMSDGSDQVLSFLPSSWNISSGTTSGTYNMTMYGAGLSPVNDLNDIRISKSNAVVGNYTTTNGTLAEPVLYRTGLTQTDLNGTYRIGSKEPITPLPVELVSFKAEKANNIVNLTWTTATERNNDFFTVERSANGNTFEVIGTVKGAGNSNTLNRYAFEDKNPANGVSYYRLKQTDFDGKFEYSKIVSVTFEGKASSIALTAYPNPAVNVLNLQVNGLNGKATLNISDATGRTVKQVTVNASETSVVNVENLPKGMYQIRLISENGTTVSKFLKQ